MSAQINSLSTEHTRQYSSVNNSTQESTSELSVFTRIDYNLRFTKQAVLISSDNTDTYSQLASQYLSHLSDASITNGGDHINVAYLSASTKLNDLQVRCRLVEQLFVNSLFDPEKSLAVSILQFAKGQSEAISIVIDHAQVLSLQIKYELCQLVNQAKKQHITINVVIFGLVSAAQQVSVNKNLFKNKIAVIDAQTGQIINLNDKRIQPQKLKKSLSTMHQIIIISILFAIAAVSTWIYQSTWLKELNYSKLSKTTTTFVSTNTDSINMTEAGAVLGNSVNNAKEAVISEKIEEASGSEINQILISASVTKKESLVQANTLDILSALTATVESNSNDELATSRQNQEKITAGVTKDLQESSTDSKSIVSPAKVNTHYFENQVVVHEQGYVIQIAVFSNKELWQGFLNKSTTVEMFSYQREQNGTPYYVVTSEVFSTKLEAKNALIALPKYITDRKPWLKDISSVMTEINTFKH